MKILVTGARGMVGTALCDRLKNIRDGKDRTRPALNVDEVWEYDVGDDAKLGDFCRHADAVFHLAGVNRSDDPEDFTTGNVVFLQKTLNALKAFGNAAPVLLASSVQAAQIGRFAGSLYGRSKAEAEECLFAYAKETGAPAAVYRFPNVMGHSRPYYNSFVATLCHCVANGEAYTVNDRNTELELVYIDDLTDAMLDWLEGRGRRCRFDGTAAIEDADGAFGFLPVTHRATLGRIADLLETFRAAGETLTMPEMPTGSFEKKLCSLYLSYLPKDQFKVGLKMNADARGSFTELLHTAGCGQVSVNISRPGVTKGQHWHASKWEIFIVVAGHGRIRERNIHTGEIAEFEVSGDKMEAVRMIPGWTHSIENLSETENLVTVMASNEIFDPAKPDTFFEEV